MQRHSNHRLGPPPAPSETESADRVPTLLTLAAPHTLHMVLTAASDISSTTCSSLCAPSTMPMPTPPRPSAIGMPQS
eukprot:364347-Chlamydomonas_euryale.AAC.5